MSENPLCRLEAFGQSIWLDFIRRGMLASGEFEQLIDEDGVSGVTSNPSIFEKAIAGSHDYDAAIRILVQEGQTTEAIYQALTVHDIQRATDLLRPIYNRTEGRDGFASIEVSPHLAYDTEGAIVEARRLWAAVDRPNVMIKVPATREGLPAIRQLIAEGINVNITLLFGLPRYHEVAEAYIAGLETRAARGLPIDRIASVASFFLSRIDVLVDPMLEKLARMDYERAELADSIHGEVALSSAKIAYQRYQEIFGEARFQQLTHHGARVQRLLWASTSTKNPTYSDVKYVEPLIGPDTINTLPLETLHAYRDHGNPAPRITEDSAKAETVFRTLLELGIDLDAVTQQLETEGVQKFIKPYDQLMDTLAHKRDILLTEGLDRQQLQLGAYAQNVQDRLAEMQTQRVAARIWRKDPMLWSADPSDRPSICRGLGWLHVAEKMDGNLRELAQFVDDIRAAGFRHVVHMGMGGSSLAPLTFQHTFAPKPNAMTLTVLDTTDPVTIRRIEQESPLEETLFIVASKSGTTAEPLAFCDFFYDEVAKSLGEKAGEHFVAITDPDSPLVNLARERQFRHCFLNYADIGGRYSALSFFGLVPATLMGVDVAELLNRAQRMAHACAASAPVDENPGLCLGAVMGELAKRGRDKVTFIMPAALATLGMWLEQLLAESTGKQGTGLLPVAGEPLGDPAVYGVDRQFIHLRLKGQDDDAQVKGVAALRDAGYPVVTIHLDDLLDLGQEFFRWEFAVAVAGAMLGINACNQPNVQESKDNTNRLLAVVADQGALPRAHPAITDGPLSLYADQAGATVVDTLRRFLTGGNPGDYSAWLAYLTEDPATELPLQLLRRMVRDRLHLTTTMGYGPRYLHSTGQYHKGGLDTGLFIELTANVARDLPIPGKPYSFGTMQRAQALGDLEALRKHGRRVIRIDLGADVGEGLHALEAAMDQAIGDTGESFGRAAA